VEHGLTLRDAKDRVRLGAICEVIHAEDGVTVVEVEYKDGNTLYCQRGVARLNPRDANVARRERGIEIAFGRATAKIARDMLATARESTPDPVDRLRAAVRHANRAIDDLDRIRQMKWQGSTETLRQEKDLQFTKALSDLFAAVNAVVLDEELDGRMLLRAGSAHHE
jgi:hypothetical protein